MTDNLYPHDFPLPAFDAEGRGLKVDDRVEVLPIPDWFLEGLEKDDQAILKGCEGRVMLIHDFDEQGFMWIQVPTLKTDDQSIIHSFAMDPKLLRKVD